MPLILPALPCTPEQHEMLTTLACGKGNGARQRHRLPMAMSLFDSWRGGSAGPATLGRAAPSTTLKCANASWPDWSWRHPKDLATGTAPC